MASDLSNSIDREVLGEHIRRFRIRQGLTQAELAARAGVTVSTVYHVEKGVSAYLTSIKKICAGLDSSLDGLLHTATSNVHEVSYILYRASSAKWYASKDRRRAVPKDNLARLRDPAERRRLASLGFVTAFLNNPHVVMEEGPGTMFIELHGRYETSFDARVFRDCKIYCQSGEIHAQIRDDVVEMGPGDIVGY